MGDGQNRTVEPAESKEPIWVKGFLAALAKTGVVCDACDAVQVGRSTVYDRRNDYPEFKRAWDMALEEGAERLESLAVKRAYQGADNVLIFLLKHNNPGKYGDRKEVHHFGQAPGQVNVQVNVDGDDDSLKRRIQRAMALLDGARARRVSGAADAQDDAVHGAGADGTTKPVPPA